MKIRHNKKRNTAFIYESLVKEATAAMLRNDVATQKKVVSIIKKHFSSDSVLKVHLDCYRSLYESRNLNKETAEKILREAKIKSRLLDTEGLFVRQSDLIKDVNKELTPEVYNTFVPNYKTLATISQIFSDKLSPKNSVILEGQILNVMTSQAQVAKPNPEIDDVVYASFVNKFNQKYEEELLQEQKVLLNYYITSFADNSLSLKTFLNEEIARLKDMLNDSLLRKEIKNDADMKQKTILIVEKLSSFYSSEANEKVLLAVLKTQRLVKEIFKDGD
tara:strand:+ start:1245 stop:2072 length:828 start_codon:yes stop_codon:yes gene_type:complete